MKDVVFPDLIEIAPPSWWTQDCQHKRLNSQEQWLVSKHKWKTSLDKILGVESYLKHVLGTEARAKHAEEDGARKMQTMLNNGCSECSVGSQTSGLG